MGVVMKLKTKIFELCNGKISTRNRVTNNVSFITNEVYVYTWLSP